MYKKTFKHFFQLMKKMSTHFSSFLTYSSIISMSIVHGYVFSQIFHHIWKSIRGSKSKQSKTVSLPSDSNIKKIVEQHMDSHVQQIIQKIEHIPSLSSETFVVLGNGSTKRILVTGGAGFVGSHLVDALMYRGHHVIVVDNLFTGRRSNIQQWEGHPHFTFMLHDVTEPLYVEVDEIYHLACPASPPHYQYNAIKTIKTCIFGTLNMLGLAKRVHAKLLFTSTSEVYGDPEVHPQSETYWGNVNPIGPRSCYDEGKRLAETIIYAYMNQHEMDIRVARIFNTYGPRMHPQDGRVVSNFIIQSLQDKPITIYGDGSQTRSFQYIDDLIEGLLLLMEIDYHDPVNIGNPQEFTIQELALMVKNKTNSLSKILHLDATQDDPTRRQPNIQIAHKILGWYPSISLSHGLDKTIDYFSEQISSMMNGIEPTGQHPVCPHRHLRSNS